VIAPFKNKALAELWKKSQTKGIDARMHSRIQRRLDALNAATMPEDTNIPGYNFHPLNGFKPTRYSIHVNGPWCITFAFPVTDAEEVDYEQYH
jgi:toxin HigB-1